MNIEQLEVSMINIGERISVHLSGVNLDTLERYPFYATELDRDPLLNEIIKQGNYNMLNAYMKSQFADLAHKRMTFRFCPNILKRWGSVNKEVA